MTTETLPSAAPGTGHAVDPTISFRRVAGALALPLAFAFQLGCNAIYAVASTGNNGDTGTGEEVLQFYAAHAGEAVACTLLALVGCLLAIPGLLTALRTLRPSKPRLGLWAVVLMTAGYVCYFGINMTNFDTLALAQIAPDQGAVVDASQSSAATPFFLVFVLGNLVGTALLGIAVILSRSFGRWAGLLILGWPVGHVINILVLNEWFAVAGGALEVVGLVIVARAALRTRDADWASRG